MEAIKVNEYVWLKLSESEKYGVDLQEGRANKLLTNDL